MRFFVGLKVFSIILCWMIMNTVADCSASDPPGSCDGPTARTHAVRRDVHLTNGNCPVGKVPFYKDNDINQLQCGDCLPGSSGATDEYYNSCDVNEYCDDSGTCQPLTSSPFYGADCPYEPGVSGFCGPGLKCIGHKCLICRDGTIDLKDGRMCLGGRWTLSKWAAISYDPAATFLLLMFLVELAVGGVTIYCTYLIIIRIVRLLIIIIVVYKVYRMKRDNFEGHRHAIDLDEYRRSNDG